jgi:[glutamine synthetase] adenylyltransferase / [glutamine synthetase]-adenylyl-L-tyrosine phosphorylase
MNNDDLNVPVLEDIHDKPKAQSLLSRLGFIDWEKAQLALQRIEGLDRQGMRTIFPYLMTALESAADPDRSLINFGRFFDIYGIQLFWELGDDPRTIEILATLFSASPFLTEILFRAPRNLKLLKNRQALSERKTIDQFQTESLSVSDEDLTDVEKMNAIRIYQRGQYLRIGTSDFLSLYDLRTVFSQLSRMAIGLVRACLVLAAAQTHIAPSGFVVLAMGKLGGWELNYSSDIDLLFVAKRDAEKYVPLAEKLIENIASATAEGFLYRVDLRLRPWGADGPLIATMDSYLNYIQGSARLWEKQAFFKARPIAGNIAFGEELRNKIEPLLFQAPADVVRDGIFRMKKQTEEMLQKKGRSWGEVKLGEGSIRDVEFVVQYLQMTHPSIRTRATMKAIPGLQGAGIISSEEAQTLSDGYIFLRAIEHYLQIVDYRQAHSLPSDPILITNLARKLGFDGHQAGELFLRRYEHTCRAIRNIFLKYVGNKASEEASELSQSSPQVLQHIARMDTSYAATFSLEEIQQHAHLASQLNSETIVVVSAAPLNQIHWRVTVVGYDFPGELSLICGLMFVYGLDIIESQVFTYESNSEDDQNKVNSAGIIHNRQQKIVDVFTVRSVKDAPISLEIWKDYSRDLHILMKKMSAGLRREARGELAKKVGEMFQTKTGAIPPLYPIDIEIDNKSSKRYTVLKIGTHDTVGFLYEFSNALAYHQINISRMFVQSIGPRVNDTIYITDANGKKITSPRKQRELRAAIVLVKHFTHLLPHSPNAETALLHFREFLSKLFSRPNWPDELVKLEKPEVLRALAKLLGVSNFLWDDFLRMQYSNLFPIVRDVDELSEGKERQKLEHELSLSLKKANDWREVLNAFKDREMFRIDMRHILGYTKEFWDFSYELTDLVEVVINEAFARCNDELSKEIGVPTTDKGESYQVTLFALGKCGGRELGFASDIELMIIYKGNNQSTDSRLRPINLYYDELIRSIIRSIEARQEGIFHIDLQLRPYGKAGSLSVSAESFSRYFSPDGPAWAYERQALVKMRLLTGDQALGSEIYRLRDEYVYNGEPFNVTEMRAMRERQIRHLVNSNTFNAKYSPGGLVDLEYLIQGLQITYGGANPSLRASNTRQAMAALAKAGIIPNEDFERLRKAHTFLRWLIDSLRVVRGNSNDVNIPPYESEEFSFLARRLRYGYDTEKLRDELARFSKDVMEINRKLLSSLI